MTLCVVCIEEQTVDWLIEKVVYPGYEVMRARHMPSASLLVRINGCYLG